ARPATLPAALDGIEQVYLAPMARTVTPFCELATEAGVRRVVALSGSSVGDDHEGSSGNEYAAVEKAVRDAGFAWTFLRPGVFMNNTLDWAPMVRAGEVATAYGDATQTPIDLGDIAAVAARVLTTEGHVGRTYVLSGPEAISLRGQVDTLGALLGKEIRFTELTRAQQRVQWVGFGVPEQAVDWMLDGFEETLRHPQVPTGVVEELLGRPGTTYAQWAEANRAVFA
ncbi:MAG TPA: NAD(P)H-binding protein, partial [Streptomyces sp.]